MKIKKKKKKERVLKERNERKGIADKDNLQDGPKDSLPFASLPNCRSYQPSEIENYFYIGMTRLKDHPVLAREGKKKIHCREVS